MSQSEVWDDERVVVVRHDVVVPSGTTLMLGAGCIVKFTEGARIVVEDGGAVVAEGAYLAAFDDDSVGGDTDMNGRRDEDIAPYPYGRDKLGSPVAAAARAARAGRSGSRAPQVTKAPQRPASDIIRAKAAS